VNSLLDHQYAMKVLDIITSPPEREPNTMLKTKLIRRLSPLKEQSICYLLMVKEKLQAIPVS
jgi:hypothetical protein